MGRPQQVQKPGAKSQDSGLSVVAGAGAKHGNAHESTAEAQGGKESHAPAQRQGTQAAPQGDAARAVKRRLHPARVWPD